MSNKFRQTGYSMQLLILFALAAGCFLIYFLVFSLLLFARSGANLTAVNDLLSDPANLPFIKWMQSLSSVLIFMVPSLLFALIADTRPLQYLGLRKGSKVVPFFLVIFIMLACIPLIGMTGHWNESVHLPHAMQGIEKWVRDTEDKAAQQTKFLLITHSFMDYLANMIMIAVLPAICEELFFRGAMQRLFIRGMRSVTGGILLTAFFFSAMHFQFLGFLPRFILGVMLGYIYIWTGSLWLAMLAHFINNGLDVTLVYLYQTGYIHTDPMKTDTVPLWIGLSSGVVVLVLFQLLKRIPNNAVPIAAETFNE